MSAGHEFYWNTDFDLRLRPKARRWREDGLVAVVDELTLQPLVGARSIDSVRVRAPVAGEFLDYLEETTGERPRIVTSPAISPERSFRPFGWNEETRELNTQYREPVEAPADEVVTEVNSRAFARRVEAQLGRGLPGGVFAALLDLEQFLEREPWPALGWLAKSNHGNAGQGNRRIEELPLTGPVRLFLEGCLAEGDHILLEPWLERVMDVAASFTVTPGGAVTEVSYHEVENSTVGGFVGAWLSADGSWLGRWREELDAVMAGAGAAIGREGYHGPVCIDAFLARRDGEVVLRAVSDINARESMSWPIRALHRRLMPDRTVHWRYHSPRKVAYPASVAEWITKLGARAFDPGERRGILLTSPLPSPGEPGNRRRKIGVLFAGRDRDEVAVLGSWFRGELRRP